MSQTTDERAGETEELLLLRCFAARRRPSLPMERRAENDADGCSARLVAAAETGEFVRHAQETLTRLPLNDILRRAIHLTISTDDEAIENSFISLFAALESVLTFFRRAGDYDLLPREDFGHLERDLRKWLKAHPLLAGESAKRGLMYEKLKELNRFPFSYVFARFCEENRLDLSDLWPVPGRPSEWPLAEIRHRLIHGDPFANCPRSALVSAHRHLRWTVERMLLAVLEWPLARTCVSSDALSASSDIYRDWQAERARLS